MGSLFSFTLIIILSMASHPWLRTEAQEIKSARLLDLVIRDYTFQSYNTNFKTGMLHNVHLPTNLSGIHVSTVRFRCGSLRRYGAQVKEFHLGIGVTIHPCIERVMIVIQELGYNWSSIYYDNYELLRGYHLVSPILGLLAYNLGDSINYNNPFEIGIQAGKSRITVDFSNTTRPKTNTGGLIPLCAKFERDGKVILKNQLSPNICVVTGHGHFGLVIESPLMPLRKKVISRWKLIVGCSIGAALGAFLLGLLLIALFVKVKKKARMEEMERRAYEEEALQVSMVGHVRAPIAPITRTLPAIEHEYRPPLS